ncbi:glycosyltransferase [Emticicia sp. CRIBPO]|uniref:glycosyltransferase family 2 protein n=1 Tax=Emticicia sp. CRIBPO TaxID=2683258 RepID=UPI001412A360|nr:glycosyltransferase family 2 protein [Emticicia sp. CRIBPO]NBA87088.1 glycosyltransferase [Emticicia sp. CRIBPO]
MRPLVNIITISFNSEKYIEQTILSVINQDYKNINYILIDGGSQDSSMEIIKKYSDHIKVILSEPDKGIADAFNKGLAYCKEGLVGFLNSDDYFSSDKCVGIIADNYTDEQTIICGSLNLITQTGSFIKKMKSRPHLLPFGMYVLHPTMYTPVSIAKKVGLFNLNYSIAIDYDWTLRAVKENSKFNVIDDVLIYMRVGGASQNTEKSHSEEKMIRQKHYKSMWLDLLVTFYQGYLSKLIHSKN